MQQVKDAASELPASPRAELVEFLLDSFVEQREENARAAWLVLAEQRMAEVRAGTRVKGTSGKLRPSAAMMAGLAGHVWSFDELFAAVLPA